MKSRAKKYEEAVIRNIKGAETYLRGTYKGMSREAIKKRLGIRQDDDRFNHLLDLYATADRVYPRSKES